MRLMKNAIYVMAVLLIGANALAVSWVGVPDPNMVFGSWHIPTNWSTGLVPVADEKVQFSGATQRPEAVISGAAISGQTVVGDGNGAVQNRLRVANGGVWNTTNSSTWTAAGYNASGHITVDRGGSMITGHRVGVGLVAAIPTTCVSTLTVNGGLVDITGNLQIGSINHKGIVYVKSGGLLEATGWEWRDSTGVWSFMDIEFGSVVIGGDVTAAVPGLIAANALTGFGGQTTPTAVFANNETTLTAPDPMNRNPVYTLVLPGSKNLTWTNLAPVAPATDVWVDVWFGTDPNKQGANYTKVVSKGKNATTVTVSAPFIIEPTTYYWQVDSYLKGNPAIVVYDANNPITEGAVTPFEVTSNTPPSVDMITPRTATWINEPTTIQVTVTDNGSSAVTVTWSAADTSGADVGPIVDPNVVFTPAVTVLPAGTTYPAVVTTTMVCNYHAAQMTVTAAVEDGNPSGLTDTASVALDCALDACQATTGPVNLDAQHPGDVALDCQLNLTDFAVYALNWLVNYQLTAPIPQ